MNFLIPLDFFRYFLFVCIRNMFGHPYAPLYSVMPLYLNIS